MGGGGGGQGDDEYVSRRDEGRSEEPIVHLLVIAIGHFVSREYTDFEKNVTTKENLRACAAKAPVVVVSK